MICSSLFQLFSVCTSLFSSLLFDLSSSERFSTAGTASFSFVGTASGSFSFCSVVSLATLEGAASDSADSAKEGEIHYRKRQNWFWCRFHIIFTTIFMKGQNRHVTLFLENG